jgi:FixJ family two-component response regulator
MPTPFTALRARRAPSISGRFETLTSRERQIMGLVAAGRLNKQIAGDLGIAEPTVKMHRGSARRKMGARTAAELVLMGQQLGLVG